MIAQRLDREDLIYMSERAKWKAVVAEIKARSEKGQPVLVGTVAIETSETLSKELKRAGIPHDVLNAKQHEREASVIAQAGRMGAVTIATNMAGRGVDILLGGNPEGLARDQLRELFKKDVTEATSDELATALEHAERIVKEERKGVLDAGGLFVLGTERHEARRIDNQLRGRSGRQGDPGESRFFLSLEDDLMRRFNSEQVKKILAWINMPEDEPIEHSMVSKTIEQAQVRVEGYNFDIRKRVLEYDDVVNIQRAVIYKQRREWIAKANETLKADYVAMIEKRVLSTFNDFAEGDNVADWDVVVLHRELLRVFPVPLAITPDTLQGMTKDDLEEALVNAVHATFESKEREFEVVKEGWFDGVMRSRILYAIDNHWQRHLTALDMLREGIGLMSIAQRDPLVEYKRDSFHMFEEMRDQITELMCNSIYRVSPQVVVNQPTRRNVQMQTNAPQQQAPQPMQKKKTLERNDPCHCGSGKKYKNCHMREDAKVSS